MNECVCVKTYLQTHTIYIQTNAFIEISTIYGLFFFSIERIETENECKKDER